MIKTCSLDFINKRFFGTDIMAQDGTVLFYADDKVTHEKLLKLYFKEIYINEKQVSPQSIVEPVQTVEMVSEAQAEEVSEPVPTTESIVEFESFEEEIRFEEIEPEPVNVPQTEAEQVIIQEEVQLEPKEKIKKAAKKKVEKETKTEKTPKLKAKETKETKKTKTASTKETAKTKPKLKEEKPKEKKETQKSKSAPVKKAVKNKDEAKKSKPKTKITKKK